MSGTALFRRVPESSGHQPNAEASERPPWDAFAADVSATYGQPSPALVARANRGWHNLGARHSRTTGDLPGVEAPDCLVHWDAPTMQPSMDLLGRACIGWERFLRPVAEDLGE